MHFIVEGYPAYAYTGGRDFDPALPARGLPARRGVRPQRVAMAIALLRAPRLRGACRGPARPWPKPRLRRAPRSRRSAIGPSRCSTRRGSSARRWWATAWARSWRSRPRCSTRQRVTNLGARWSCALPMTVGDAFLAAARDDSPAALDMEAVWGHARLASLATSGVPGRRCSPRAAASTPARARCARRGPERMQCLAPERCALSRNRVPTLVVAGQSRPDDAVEGRRVPRRGHPRRALVTLDAGHAMMGEAPRAAWRRCATSSRVKAGNTEDTEEHREHGENPWVRGFARSVERSPEAQLHGVSLWPLCSSLCPLCFRL